VVDVASGQLVRGRFYDFARWGKALAAGGSYRTVFGAQTMVFEIDPYAEPGFQSYVGCCASGDRGADGATRC